MFKENNEMTNNELFEALEKAQSQIITDITSLCQFSKNNEMLRISYEHERLRDIDFPLGLVINQ